MDEYVVKQKIQNACVEPHPPEGLIQQVIHRAEAVTMGVQAQKQLETAPAEQVSQLASRGIIGQLATVTELPKGVAPEELARQLEQAPEFAAALLGGNVAARLSSGQLMQQIAAKQAETTENTLQQKEPELEQPQIDAPVKNVPKIPGIG